MAAERGVPSLVVTRTDWREGTELLAALEAYAIDSIVLAGFLWLIPPYLVQAFPDKIVNIHPALLPKYGGKGMYGHHVHAAVKAAGDLESGITIHYVNENYDEGSMIYQAAVRLDPNDSPGKDRRAGAAAGARQLLAHRAGPGAVGTQLAPLATVQRDLQSRR